MEQYNPYLFPFGPNYQRPSSSPAESNGGPFDAFDLEATVSSVPPARKRQVETEFELEAPHRAQIVAPSLPTDNRSKKPAATANSAVASMILGIMSLVGFFMGLTVFVGLGAIITGHIGLKRIKQSAGALTGKGMATTGLITGYAGFALSLVVIIMIANMVMGRPGRPGFGEPWDMEKAAREEQWAADKAKTAAREEALSEVEEKLEDASANSAHGNNAQAKKLAEDFNTHIKVMATKGPGGHIPALQDLTFATHCELHDDRAAFMVVVHGSDRGADPEKGILKELSWVTVWYILRQSLPESHHVALNLRNPGGSIVSLYGTVGDIRPRSEIDRNSLAKFYAESEDDLIPISPILMQQYPNRGLQGRPPADLASATPRQQLGGPTLPSLRPPSSMPSRAGSNPGLQLQVQLRKAPPSGIRQQGHTLQPYTDQPFVLNAIDYAPLIFDTDRSPSGDANLLSDITAACFSPDGKRLAVGVTGGVLVLYELDQERVTCFPKLPGSFHGIRCLAYSPDGKKVFYALQSGDVGYWDVEHPETGGQAVALSKPKGFTEFLAVSPDSKTLYCAASREIFRQSTNSGGAIQNFAQSKSPIVHMTLDENGTGLLYTDGRELSRVDFKTQRKETLEEFGRLFFHPCDISPTAKLLATKDRHSVLLRTFADGRNDSFPPDMRVSSMQFTPQGDRLLITRSGTVSVWDVNETAEIAAYKIDTNFDPLVRDISPDGRFAAVQNHLRDSVMYVLPLPDAITRESSETPAAEPEPATLAKVAPDASDSEMAATVPESKNPFNFDSPEPAAEEVDSSPVAAAIKQLPIIERIDAVFRDLRPGIDPIAFSASGKHILAGKGDSMLMYLSLDKNSKDYVPVKNMGTVSAICYSADGTAIFAGTTTGKVFALAIDDTPNLVNQRELTGHQGEVTCLIAGMGGKFIASAGKDQRVVWQQITANGKSREVSLAGSPLVQLCELPGQSTLLATDGKQYTRIKLVTAETAADEPLTNFAKSAGQISISGKLVATIDGMHIQTWDLEAEKPLATLAPAESPRDVQFTPDGRYLLSVGSSKVTVFHPQESKALAEFVFPRGSEIHRLTISPNGKQFAAYIDKLGQSLYVVSLAGLEASE